MNDLNDVLDKIETFCKPMSTFLYGSRARTDFLEKSDYEIGVLMYEDKYVEGSDIRKKINEESFNIYPFKYEDFIKRKIDTPFQNSIYLRELIGTGKTLRGKKVIESMKLPSISVIDIMQDLRFNIGYALASIISQRNADFKTASMGFYKSCLFGTRNLIILTLKKFAFTYDDIYKFSQEINLAEYENLVLIAYNLREGNSTYEDNHLFQNISFLNKFIEPKIVEFFEKYGNKTLIP